MTMSFPTKLAFVLMACIMAVLTMVPETLAQNSQDDFVTAHNSARSEVNVGPVTWDPTVAAYAQAYANERSSDCNLIHSGGPYGENLFGGFGADFTAGDAVAAWVAEKQYYDHDTNSCAAGKECGHYTQVVWRSSTSIGCARVKCSDGGIFIICNYNPRGNIIGESPY